MAQNWNGPPRAPRYDAAEITRHIAELTDANTAWTRWFDREGITPLRLSYDSLAQDPLGTLSHVLMALGLDRAAAHGVTVPTAKLADATTRDWIQRYRAEVRPKPSRHTD